MEMCTFFYCGSLAKKKKTARNAMPPAKSERYTKMHAGGGEGRHTHRDFDIADLLVADSYHAEKKIAN